MRHESPRPKQATRREPSLRALEPIVIDVDDIGPDTALERAIEALRGSGLG